MSQLYYCGMAAATLKQCAIAGTAAIVLAALAVSLSSNAYAGPGHDHGGESSAAVGGAAWPRFAAVSEAFELVGIVNGKQLTLYLDHANTNAPVKNATLEIEFGGAKLKIEPRAEGEFAATLPTAPKSGVTPIIATVVAGKESDLLTGELDIHDEPAAATSALQRWMKWLPWGAGIGIIFIGAWVLLRWLRRKPSSPSTRAGGAA